MTTPKFPAYEYGAKDGYGITIFDYPEFWKVCIVKDGLIVDEYAHYGTLLDAQDDAQERIAQLIKEN